MCINTTLWRCIGLIEVQLYTFLTPAANAPKWSSSCSGRFTHRGRTPGAHWSDSHMKMGLSANVDVMMKIMTCAPSGVRSEVVQVITSHLQYSLEKQTNSMEQSSSPSWEANNHSDIQRIPRLSRNPKFHKCSRKSATGPYPEPDEFSP